MLVPSVVLVATTSNPQFNVYKDGGVFILTEGRNRTVRAAHADFDICVSVAPAASIQRLKSSFDRDVSPLPATSGSHVVFIDLRNTSKSEVDTVWPIPEGALTVYLNSNPSTNLGMLFTGTLVSFIPSVIANFWAFDKITILTKDPATLDHVSNVDYDRMGRFVRAHNLNIKTHTSSCCHPVRSGQFAMSYEPYPPLQFDMSPAILESLEWLPSNLETLAWLPRLGRHVTIGPLRFVCNPSFGQTYRYLCFDESAWTKFREYTARTATFEASPRPFSVLRYQGSVGQLSKFYGLCLNRNSRHIVRSTPVETEGIFD